MYLPDEHFEQAKFVIQYSNSTIVYFDIGSEYGYYRLYYDAPSFGGIAYNFSRQGDYKFIVVNYRAYVKSAYFVDNPPLNLLMEELENRFVNYPAFTTVYDSGSWHKVYVNQTYTSEGS
jgi:hypothetical protein